MYLVDTNVLSERRKGRRADPGVAEFVDRKEHEIFVPVFVIGELRGGIERLRRRGDQPQAASLEVWLQTVHEDFAARILAFDLTCAETWGQLMSIDTQNPIDKQLAAMALVYDLSVVTHNVSHFEGTGVRVLNPFAADAGPLIL